MKYALLNLSLDMQPSTIRWKFKKEVRAMEDDFEEIKELNREACEIASVEEWASWREGEEGF